MIRRHLSWRALFIVVGVLAWSPLRSAAETTITADPAPLRVTGAHFDARVEGDGCLTSFRIEGREFLAPGVAVSRGAYFFRNGTLQLADIERPDDATIIARGNEAQVEYRFRDDGVVCIATNESQTPTAFFLVLAKDLAAVITPAGETLAPAVEQDIARACFAIGDAKLEMSGLGRLWGPWQGPHQVCEAMLAPGETREIVLTAGKLTPAERTSVVSLLAPPAAAPLTILSPQEYQVVQRSTLEKGECLISGRIAAEADTVEYRVVGESKHGALPGDWQAADFMRSTQSFSALATLPAGGWYALNVRAKLAGNVAAEATVPRFGVGEVFVGAGQSNSTNCGQFTTKQTSGMVASFGGDRWKLADDPQLGVADRSTGGSFWPAFGDAMHERYGVPIGVAATGFGGTSVTQWQPDGELYPWMMTRVRQLGPGGFRALLWHQGESDVDLPGNEYYLKLKRLIETSRIDAKWPIPWFVAQATYHNMQRQRSEPIRLAQARLWQEGVALRGPDTDELQEEFRDFDGKGIHLSPKGLKRHGEMWADLVGPLVDEQLGLSPASGALPRPRAVQWPEADALFHRDPRWLGGDDAYSIDLGEGRVAWFFGDSFVEPQTPGMRRGSTMVRNSVGVQTGYDPTTADFVAYWAHDGDKPTSLIPDDGEDFYWPGGGVILDGKLLLCLMRARNAETNLHFKTSGWGAVLIDQLNETPDKWRITKVAAPQNEFGILVGSGSLVVEGDYVYAFSHRKRGIVLARWPRVAASAGNLSPLEWYDPPSKSWIAQTKLAEPPLPILSPGQTEFTVQRQHKFNRYLQVQFIGFPQSAVGYRTAAQLAGPWSPLEPLFAPEEMLTADPEVMLYAGKLHPEQTAQGIALTYASNSFGLARVVDDSSLYYPRFAQVQIPGVVYPEAKPPHAAPR